MFSSATLSVVLNLDQAGHRHEVTGEPPLSGGISVGPNGGAAEVAAGATTARIRQIVWFAPTGSDRTTVVRANRNGRRRAATVRGGEVARTEGTQQGQNFWTPCSLGHFAT